MTAPHILNPAALLEKGLADASPDLMRHLLTVVVNALLSADADRVCGAEYGVASADRVNSRNGYRHRDLDTRAGTIDVAIPKLRSGTYFPEWLLERRKRAEAALVSVVATCYLLGVSTRRMDKLVQSLGIDGLSKSQVSRMAADLDEQVTAFRTRPLDEAGPFVFVAADALTMKVREHGRVVNAVVLVATGVNADGHREVLGVKVATSETKQAWNTFFADLVAHKEVRETYLNTAAAADLRGRVADEVSFGGISFRRYRGNAAFGVPADKAFFYPEGVDGLFEIYYAPADTFETVNTLGLPLYARAIPDRERDEWVRLEIESNPLPICTRPQVLRSARRT